MDTAIVMVGILLVAWVMVWALRIQHRSDARHQLIRNLGILAEKEMKLSALQREDLLTFSKAYEPQLQTTKDDIEKLRLLVNEYQQVAKVGNAELAFLRSQVVAENALRKR